MIGNIARDKSSMLDHARTSSPSFSSESSPQATFVSSISPSSIQAASSSPTSTSSRLDALSKKRDHDEITDSTPKNASNSTKWPNYLKVSDIKALSFEKKLHVLANT